MYDGMIYLEDVAKKKFLVLKPMYFVAKGNGSIIG